jgi:hypothetical protein
MKRIHPSAAAEFCLGHALGDGRRAEVVKHGRGISAVVPPDDLEFLLRERPQPEDEEDVDDRAVAGNGQGSRAFSPADADVIRRGSAAQVARLNSGTLTSQEQADADAYLQFEAAERAARVGTDRANGTSDEDREYARRVRHFLIRACGMDEWETDAGAQKHFDGLHPDLQAACRTYAEHDDDGEEDDDEEERQAARSYPASGPGRQADSAPAAALDGPFQHQHVAQLDPPTSDYDEVMAPQIMEPGVEVTSVRNRETYDERPILVRFDAARFDPDSARAWLSAKHLTPSGFQAADTSDADGDQGHRAATAGDGDVIRRAGEEMELAAGLAAAEDFLREPGAALRRAVACNG